MPRTLHEHLPLADAEPHALPWTRLMRVVPLLLLLSLLIFPVFLSDSPAMRWFFGLSLLAFAVVTLYLVLGWRAQRPGSLRFAASGPLTLRRPLAAQLLLTLAPLLVGVAGVASLLAWQEPGGRGLRLAATALFLGVGVFGTLSAVLHTRSPAGLEISPHGLRWRRSFTTATLDWHELAAAEEPGQGNDRLLRLHTRSGTVSKIYPLAFGSDPVVVTALVTFYLENESQRELLNDPRSAVAVFAEHAKLRRS